MKNSTLTGNSSVTTIGVPEPSESVESDRFTFHRHYLSVGADITQDENFWHSIVRAVGLRQNFKVPEVTAERYMLCVTYILITKHQDPVSFPGGLDLRFSICI
jgi:hypothetical protein